MTDVRMRLLVQALARQGIAGATTTWRPTRAVTAPAGLLLPATRTVAVPSTGTVILTGIVPCSGADGWAYEVTVSDNSTVVYQVTVLVPDQATVVDFETGCPLVDPATLDPVMVAESAWWAAIHTEAASAASRALATALSEYPDVIAAAAALAQSDVGVLQADDTPGTAVGLSWIEHTIDWVTGSVEDAVGAGSTLPIPHSQSVPLLSGGVMDESVLPSSAVRDPQLVEALSNRVTDDELDAALAALPVRVSPLAATGNVIEAANGRGFVIKGVNLGYRTTDGQGRMDATFLDPAYDQQWVHDCIDQIAALGCNTVRIQGGYWIYVQAPAAYKARVHDAWAYAHSQGLRVLATLMDSTDMPIGSDKIPPAEAYILDMLDGFTDTPMMMWDVGNELEDPAPAITLAQYLRTVRGAGQLITASGTAVGSWVTALDPYVDFHDWHFYYPPSYDWFGDAMMAIATSRTTKPIVIGEIGTNANGAGNAPRASDPAQRAAYLRQGVRFVEAGAVQGLIAWKLTSNGSPHDFGLIDAAGTPTPALAEVAAWPASRPPLAGPGGPTIVHDNFGRADSPTTVGTPPVGPAPTTPVGTWGVSSRRGRLATSAGARNLMLWDAHTSECGIEAEWALDRASTAAQVGIVTRYADANNYLLWLWDQTVGLSLILRSGGVDTDVTPTNYRADATSGGVPIGGTSPTDGEHLRLGVRAGGSLLTGLMYDTAYAYWQPAGPRGTLHGLMHGTDTLPAIRSFTITGHGRIL